MFHGGVGTTSLHRSPVSLCPTHCLSLYSNTRLRVFNLQGVEVLMLETTAPTTKYFPVYFVGRCRDFLGCSQPPNLISSSLNSLYVPSERTIGPYCGSSPIPFYRHNGTGSFPRTSPNPESRPHPRVLCDQFTSLTTSSHTLEQRGPDLELLN